MTDFDPVAIAQRQQERQREIQFSGGVGNMSRGWQEAEADLTATLTENARLSQDLAAFALRAGSIHGDTLVRAEQAEAELERFRSKQEKARLAEALVQVSAEREQAEARLAAVRGFTPMLERVCTDVSYELVSAVRQVLAALLAEAPAKGEK